jgi:HEXXH motif-containing protein
VISRHRLPETAFSMLATGLGGQAVVSQLREAQHSKHAMLLVAIAGAARDADPVDPGPVAFRTAYELLTRIQALDPGGSRWLLTLPHLGSWAHDALIRLEQESVPDFAYLTSCALRCSSPAGGPRSVALPVPCCRPAA